MLFPTDKREAKVVEFINLRQRSTNVLEHSLNLTKLSKYAPSLVSDPRDDMNCFVTGVSDDWQEVFHSVMVHENMTISTRMVHAQQVEEASCKRTSRDSKKARSFDSRFSKNRLEIQDNPRFKKQVSNKVPSKFTNSSQDRVSYHKRMNGKVTTSPTEKPTCGKYGKKHYHYCLKRTDNYFGCGKIGHKGKYYPNLRVKTRVVVKL